MIREDVQRPPEYVYPVEEWRLVEKRFNPEYLGQTETFFATTNGYLGMRGCFEEGAPVHANGTFVNGFYESWQIPYGEEAYGFAKIGQTIVNVTDGKTIKLYVDDEPFYLPTADLLEFERALDMQCGTLDRRIVWETPSGKRVSIVSRRLVSFRDRHLAAISYEVTLLNADAPVVISSEVSCELAGHTENSSDPRKTRGLRGRVLLPRVAYSRDYRIVLGHQTKASRMTLGCGVDHMVESTCAYSSKTTHDEDRGKVVFSVDARAGMFFRLTKFICYHTSRRSPAEELCERAERTLDRARSCGFEEYLNAQRHYLDQFWSQADVTVDGHPALQQAMRFNLFQIIQAAARAEGGGIPAKGLTGDGYEGHYFWDTEIYVLPFLIYTEPRIAKNLLRFRYSFLDKARERAREVNQRGALFPWRTISGSEASSYYAAGTAQYHIDADIMYALKKYVQVTGDEQLLEEIGAEMLVETARLWFDLGFFSDRRDGKFCIAGVTGPDEYNTVVNNNTFTNLMARQNLRYAAEVVGWLDRERPEQFAVLLGKTGVQMSEVEDWKRAADNMYIAYEEELGIHLQDDEFLDKKPWDFENTPHDKYPLMLHHHPLVIYRHQLIKQADVILAMLLLGNEFSAEQKRRNFDFYDPLTTGDSSLSVSVQAVIAFELDYLEQARRYFTFSALMDLADVAGNASDGCHIASMGGTWMAAVYGFAGMRDYEGQISFDPKLPEQIERIRIPLTIQGQILRVDIDKESVTYSLEGGQNLRILHRGRDVVLKPGKAATFSHHNVDRPASTEKEPTPRRERGTGERTT